MFNILESYIDPPQKNKNEYVWINNKLNKKIKEKIIEILDNYNISFKEVYIIGSITTKYWSEDSDIDITVFTNVDDNNLKTYRKIISVINERWYFGFFPLNFYFRNDELKDIKIFADGIYNVLKDKWVKEPQEIENIDELIKNSKHLAEKIASRLDIQLDEIATIIDNLVKNINLIDTHVDYQEQIDFLELELQDYIKTLDDIHKRRIDEFKAILEKEDFKRLKRYKSFNLLPWNIVFKFLVKWLYYKWKNIFEDNLKNNEIKKREIYNLFYKFVRFWLL